VHLLAKDRQQGMKPFSPHQTLLSPTTPPSPKSQTKETQERVQRGQEGWLPWQLPTTNAGYSSSSSKRLCLCRKAKTRLRLTLSNNPLSSPTSRSRDVSHLRDHRLTSQERQIQMGRKNGRAMPTEWQSTPNGFHPALPGRPKDFLSLGRSFSRHGGRTKLYVMIRINI